MRFSNMVGVQDLIEKVQNLGYDVTPIDIMIADEIFAHTSTSVRIETEDLDGIANEYVAGYIYDNKVQNLINAYPAAALMVYFIDEKVNYGFFNSQTGKIEKAGMIGDYNPILGAQGLVASYIGTTFERKHLFDNEETFEIWQERTNGDKIRHSFARYGVNADEYYNELGSYDPRTYYDN